MNEDELIVFFCKRNLLFQNHHLVLRVLVQSNFTDPQHIVFFEKLGNQCDDFASETWIIRLFGIDAEPREMLNSKLAEV